MKNEITRVIKIVLLFVSMAIMNLMLLGILAMLGFSLTAVWIVTSCHLYFLLLCCSSLTR